VTEIFPPEEAALTPVGAAGGVVSAEGDPAGSEAAKYESAVVVKVQADEATVQVVSGVVSFEKFVSVDRYTLSTVPAATDEATGIAMVSAVDVVRPTSGIPY